MIFSGDGVGITEFLDENEFSDDGGIVGLNEKVGICEDNRNDKDHVDIKVLISFCI